MKLKNFFKGAEPLIIIGCHRSGTSVITDLLVKNGLFLGHDLSDHTESVSFMKINESLLNETNSKWFQVQEFLKLSDQELDQCSKRVFQQLDSSLFINEYLGNFFQRNLSTRRRNKIWGWKDPRNTITLPVWLKLFPNAKVLHLYRHGFDVANSLTQRELRRDKLSDLFAKDLMKLENSLKLWEVYENNALSLLQNIDINRKLSLSFESFFTEPILNAEKLSSFLSKDISIKSGILDESKVFKYLNSKRDFHELKQKVPMRLFESLGYEFKEKE